MRFTTLSCILWIIGEYTMIDTVLFCSAILASISVGGVALILLLIVLGDIQVAED
jgi:hypothetical protein